MLTQNGTHLNGNGHVRMLHCESDYEPRPIDVTPKTPQPKWRDSWPEYTHNVNWLDSDSKQHSLTIRTDSIDELLATLTAIKHVIRASKAKTAEGSTAKPLHSDPQGPAADCPDVQRCAIHGTNMPRRWSKRTNGHYFGHKLSDGSFCYGRAKS
jgi:hypothetical protein